MSQFKKYNINVNVVPKKTRTHLSHENVEDDSARVVGSSLIKIDTSVSAAKVLTSDDLSSQRVLPKDSYNTSIEDSASSINHASNAMDNTFVDIKASNNIDYDLTSDDENYEIEEPVICDTEKAAIAFHEGNNHVVTSMGDLLAGIIPDGNFVVSDDKIDSSNNNQSYTTSAIQLDADKDKSFSSSDEIGEPVFKDTVGEIEDSCNIANRVDEALVLDSFEPIKNTDNLVKQSVNDVEYFNTDKPELNNEPSQESYTFSSSIDEKYFTDNTVTQSNSQLDNTISYDKKQNSEILNIDISTNKSTPINNSTNNVIIDNVNITTEETKKLVANDMFIISDMEYGTNMPTKVEQEKEECQAFVIPDYYEFENNKTSAVYDDDKFEDVEVAATTSIDEVANIASDVTGDALIDTSNNENKSIISDSVQYANHTDGDPLVDNLSQSMQAAFSNENTIESGFISAVCNDSSQLPDTVEDNDINMNCIMDVSSSANDSMTAQPNVDTKNSTSVALDFVEYEAKSSENDVAIKSEPLNVSAQETAQTEANRLEPISLLLVDDNEKGQQSVSDNLIDNKQVDNTAYNHIQETQSIEPIDSSVDMNNSCENSEYIEKYSAKISNNEVNDDCKSGTLSTECNNAYVDSKDECEMMVEKPKKKDDVQIQSNDNLVINNDEKEKLIMSVNVEELAKDSQDSLLSLENVDFSDFSQDKINATLNEILGKHSALVEKGVFSQPGDSMVKPIAEQANPIATTKDVESEPHKEMYVAEKEDMNKKNITQQPIEAEAVQTSVDSQETINQSEQENQDISVLSKKEQKQREKEIKKAAAREEKEIADIERAQVKSLGYNLAEGEQVIKSYNCDAKSTTRIDVTNKRLVCYHNGVTQIDIDDIAGVSTRYEKQSKAVEMFLGIALALIGFGGAALMILGSRFGLTALDTWQPVVKGFVGGLGAILGIFGIIIGIMCRSVKQLRLCFYTRNITPFCLMRSRNIKHNDALENDIVLPITKESLKMVQSLGAIILNMKERTKQL